MRREVDGANQTHAFFYDNLYELVQETHPDFGTLGYSYDLNGNRTAKYTNGTPDYYGVDVNNKLLWVNRNVNAAPTSGQSNPYTLFGYDAAGRMVSRERRYDSGLLRNYSFLWDGDDRLRQVNEGATNRFTASYDGGGVRISKADSWTGTHNYSWGPGGLLADSSASTTYTPGFSQRQGSTDRFFQDDWLGNTRYLADSTGNGFPKTARYTAFGERSLDWGPDPYDFSDFQFVGVLVAGRGSERLRARACQSVGSRLPRRKR